MAKLTFVFYEKAGCKRIQYLEAILATNQELIDKRLEIESVLAFYVSKIFTYRQLTDQHQKWENQGNIYNPEDMSVQMKEETLTGLLKLGGGALGAIRKVGYKGRINKKLSVRQQIEQHQLFKMTTLVRMTKTEKVENVTIELQDRDRGGMLFAKPGFLALIRKVNSEVRNYANPKAFISYGKNLIKQATENINQKLDCLRDLYEEGILTEGITVVSPEISTIFFKIWIRKMVHCRIQEFISSHTQMKKTKKTDVSLRDKLLVLTDRGSKSKPIKRKGASSNSSERDSSRARGRARGRTSTTRKTSTQRKPLMSMPSKGLLEPPRQAIDFPSTSFHAQSSQLDISFQSAPQSEQLSPVAIEHNTIRRSNRSKKNFYSQNTIMSDISKHY